MQNYDQAIANLDLALKAEPDNAAAVLDRAIAYMRKGNLDSAEADYTHLKKLYPNARQVYFGLAEIAYQRKDTNAAILNYEAYLTNTAPSSAEYLAASNRLYALRGNKTP
jgi:Flp pilus assembly protein TadD